MSNRGTDLMALFPGLVLPYAGSGSPPAGSGWLPCDGAAVSRTTYAGLFAAIGETYGVGDGSTTFNVPDLRGRSVIGVGQGSGLTDRALAASGGAETHQLSTAEMPLHGHPFQHAAVDSGSSNTAGGLLTDTSGTITRSAFTGAPSNTAGEQIGGTGGGGTHNNMQPFMALRYVIKT